MKESEQLFKIEISYSTCSQRFPVLLVHQCSIRLYAILDTISTPFVGPLRSDMFRHVAGSCSGGEIQ